MLGGLEVVEAQEGDRQATESSGDAARVAVGEIDAGDAAEDLDDGWLKSQAQDLAPVGEILRAYFRRAEAEVFENPDEADPVVQGGIDPDVEVQSEPGVAMVDDGEAPTTMNRTSWSRHNFKKSLKSGGSCGLAIDDVAELCQCFEAFGGCGGVPIGAGLVLRRCEVVQNL